MRVLQIKVMGNMLSKDHTINSNIEEFNIDFIDKELEALHYSEETKFNVRLVIEEVVTNIMQHSKCKDDIHLNLIYFENKINIRLADTGVKFNPLEVYSECSVADDIEEVKTEGLGILIAKKKSESIFYKRIGKYNILSMNLLAN